MKRVRLTVTSENFHRLDGVRVQQGHTWAGPEIQGAVLKSCVCIGFYCADRKIGATCHITGFHNEGAHHVGGALTSMEQGLHRHGVELSDCNCFLLGGATRARHVYDSAVAELRRRGMPCEELDVLGDFHRKFVFNPATGVVVLYKKSTEETNTEPEAGGASGEPFACFHDPSRRVITGASLFFRNQRLIDSVQNHILPDLLGRGKRLHVWCAGCSNGMEAYSMAMLMLDYIERNRLSGIELRVLGTDIADEALETARKGQYQLTERAQKSHPDLFRKYLERIDGGRVLVGPSLRQVVTFVQRDIREGSRRHLFDLVICDHVLQYFSVAIQSEMVGALLRAVIPAGYAYISSPSRLACDQIATRHQFRVLGPHLYQQGGTA